MDKDFDFKQVPYGWAMCYVEACPRKDECLRYQVYLSSLRRTMHNCVMPGALLKKTCPHFHPIRKMRVAIGFRYIFEKVLARDIASMRSEMASFLGCRATFYRYRRGDQPLNPRQQKWIQEMFRRHGYTDEIVFDKYKDVYVFD